MTKSTSTIPETRRVGFVLMPGFALTSFSLAIEALSVVNHLSGQTLYDYTLYDGNGAADESPVLSSNNVPVQPSAPVADCWPCDVLVVCAHRNAARYGNRELYPDIPLRQQLYTIHGNVMTCAGGTTALDMFLYLIGRDFGQEVATRVSEKFLQDRIRSREEIQNTRRSLQLRMKSPHLGAAIELMEANLERPWSIERLAREVGTTTRTLEYLFRRFEQTTPGRYYLHLRLRCARRLIEETNLSISTVGYSTGFSSQSYFSRRFREAFGVQPRRLREEQKHQ